MLSYLLNSNFCYIEEINKLVLGVDYFTKFLLISYLYVLFQSEASLQLRIISIWESRQYLPKYVRLSFFVYIRLGFEIVLNVFWIKSQT